MAGTIQAIPLGTDNVYVAKDRRVILVDGGWPGKFALFARRLREAGVSTRDVGLIAATHGHWGHIGCPAELKLHTGAPLAMHAADRSSIERPHPVMAPGVDAERRNVLGTLSTPTEPLAVPLRLAIALRPEWDSAALAELKQAAELIRSARPSRPRRCGG